MYSITLKFLKIFLAGLPKFDPNPQLMIYDYYDFWIISNRKLKIFNREYRSWSKIQTALYPISFSIFELVKLSWFENNEWISYLYFIHSFTYWFFFRTCPTQSGVYWCEISPTFGSNVRLWLRTKTGRHWRYNFQEFLSRDK